MKGICKTTDSTGVVTHVVVDNGAGGKITVTVEEYTDQELKPLVFSLPVCRTSDAKNA